LEQLRLFLFGGENDFDINAAGNMGEPCTKAGAEIDYLFFRETDGSGDVLRGGDGSEQRYERNHLLKGESTHIDGCHCLETIDDFGAFG
jgi:hypothetical protein